MQNRLYMFRRSWSAPAPLSGYRDETPLVLEGTRDREVETPGLNRGHACLPSQADRTMLGEVWGRDSVGCWQHLDRNIGASWLNAGASFLVAPNDGPPPLTRPLPSVMH